MIYLSGASHSLIHSFSVEGLGILVTPRHGRPPVLGIPWAIDNDCFNQGDAFQWADFITWLGKLSLYQHSCLFVPAPDVVGDADTTLRKFTVYGQLIRGAGWQVALVAQDGLSPEDIPWEDIDALFIGGSTDWKLSGAARDCVEEAKRQGKWVHMGRVNSEKRFKLAYSWGIDSVDGTFLKYGPDTNWPKLKRWLRNNLQGRFVDVVWEPANA